MNKETFNMIVEGGKAVPNPNLAQRLGPAGINLGQVLTTINEKTSSFRNMKVPVKIIADTKAKTFEIEIGSPPTHELIKSELNLQKGSSMPDKQKVANISIEQVIKIAKMKKDSMLVKTLKAAVKSVAGSCNSAGILIEGKKAHEICEAINQGMYDELIQQEKTEPSAEKKSHLKQQLDTYNERIKKELEKAAALAPKPETKKEEAVPAEPAAVPAGKAAPGAKAAAGKAAAPAAKAATPAAAKAVPAAKEAKPTAKGKK